MSIQQAFALGLQHHQAGRLRDAENVYRQILAAQPGHVESMHGLGLIAHQVGRNDVSVDLIRRAISLKPDYVVAMANLGKILRDDGRPDEAIDICRRAIAIDARFGPAYANLGLALMDNERLNEAIEALRRAIALSPNLAEAHSNLGNALLNLGQVEEAIVVYRQAIACNPNLPEGHNNLGAALLQLERWDEALAAFSRAIALRPDMAAAHYNLGKPLVEKKMYDAAIAAYRKSIELEPDNPKAWCNLGIALKDSGRLDEATSAYRQAIALKPEFAEALSNLGMALREQGQANEAIAACLRSIGIKPDLAAYVNLGNALRDAGRIDESIAAFRQAVRLAPDDAGAHTNLGMMLLSAGQFAEGWDEYEWRWKKKDFTSPIRNFSQPQWDGSALEGRTILLHAEQGFGDAIHFMRYVPMVATRGGTIIVECQPELERLLRASASVDADGSDDADASADADAADRWTVIQRGQTLPAFDVHCPLVSLAKVFRTRADNIPAPASYLKADAETIEKWRRRMTEYAGELKVGLSWAGSPTHKEDRSRSMRLAMLAPLARVTGVRFFSLQKGPAAAEAAALSTVSAIESGAESAATPAKMKLIDWTGDLTDFAESAGLVANLDLVISVDTAVVHLAGALGKPVWTLLPYAADWRWGHAGEQSAWYPTMRLFRQTTPGDWASVIARVAESLETFRADQVAAPRSSSPGTPDFGEISRAGRGGDGGGT